MFSVSYNDHLSHCFGKVYLAMMHKKRYFIWTHPTVCHGYPLVQKRTNQSFSDSRYAAILVNFHENCSFFLLKKCSLFNFVKIVNVLVHTSQRVKRDMESKLFTNLAHLCIMFFFLERQIQLNSNLYLYSPESQQKLS